MGGRGRDGRGNAPPLTHVACEGLQSGNLCGMTRIYRGRVKVPSGLLASGTVAGTVQGSISVTAADVCTGSGGRLHDDYTEQVLEYRIEVNYLTYSLHELTNDVSVSECGGRRRRRGVNDVVISVTITGVYESVAQHLRPSSGVLGCWPDGLQLTPGLYPGSNERHRLFWAST